jgi:hypothetical protein
VDKEIVGKAKDNNSNKTPKLNPKIKMKDREEDNKEENLLVKMI